MQAAGKKKLVHGFGNIFTDLTNFGAHWCQGSPFFPLFSLIIFTFLPFKPQEILSSDKITLPVEL